MRKFLFCLALLSLLPVTGLPAQNADAAKDRKVTVTDALGPVAGASVMIKGTATGSSTDLDGIAVISCEDDDILVVSFIGSKTEEITAGSRSEIAVYLQEDMQRLVEVVVVGYNTVRRAQTTGALSQVAGEKLEYQSSATLESRLQGQTPGVMVSLGSGQPGSEDLSIRIRGTGSINGSNTPLYIMDGVMVEPADFAALNSNDIEDIQILKDASATAVYGSRGANGVIVIQTKSGKAGRTTVNYRNQFGFSFLVDYIDMMNAEENLQYQLQCVQSEPNSSFFPMMQILRREMEGTATEDDLAKLASARSTDTDWIDEMTRTGFQQEHSISVSGGNDKTRFYVSGSYLTQEGILNKSGLDRYSLRFNLDHQIARWLDFGLKATAGYSKTDFSDPEAGSGRNNWSNPWFTALLAYPYESPDDWYNVDNPTLITKYYDRTAGKLKTTGSMYLRANITKWLSFKSNFGVDFMYDRSTTTLHRDHPNAQQNHGYYSNSASELFRYTWTNTLNVNKDFDNGHSLNAVVGMEMFQGKYFSSNFTGYDLNEDMMDTPAGIGDKTGASDYPPTVGGGRTMSNLLSFFAQASYSINNKYNISASLRNDTSSKFYGRNANATFWSVGASWLMSSENWLKNTEWLNLLKIRASYGTTGNQDGVNDFGTFDGYTNSSYNGESGYAHSQLGNNELRWETSAQANVGVDFSVLDSRINLTVDLYHIKTKDLYMSKNISLTSGFSSILTNAGSVVNKGIEIGVNTTPVKIRNFRWDLGFNWTYNHNAITDLGTWANEENKYVSGYNIYEVGRPLGTWRMPYYAGVNPDNGLVMFYDNYGQLTSDINDAYYGTHFGTYEPPFFGGINTTFAWKGLTLTALFTYAYDYTVMNAGRWYTDNHFFNGNKPTYMLDMWMEPGDVTDVPAFREGTQPSPMASQFLEDASYIRLKNVRLSWQLPEKWMQKTGFIRTLMVYVQGENLYTWTKYRGADPEVNGSIDYMAYPKPRTLTFGIDVNF